MGRMGQWGGGSYAMRCDVKRSALRWPMQRTAMADAAHCDDRCSTLRPTTLDFRLKTEAD